MPLLRYDVGDVVEVAVPQCPCPCGRRMPRLHRILGRQEDVVIRPDGQVVTASFIVFDRSRKSPRDKSSRPIWTACASGWFGILSTQHESEAELLSCLRRFVGPEMTIEFEYLPPGVFHEETGAGKFRMIVSQLRQPPDTCVGREHIHQLAGG